MHNLKSQPVTSIDVCKTWFPLALSWLMMGIELPLLSAVVARLANPEVNLGAYGGVPSHCHIGALHHSVTRVRIMQ